MVLLVSFAWGRYDEKKRGRFRVNEAAFALRAQEINNNEIEQGEVSYALSPFATKVLSEITYDDLAERTFTASDADILTAGILRLRGPATKNPRALDHATLVRSLLEPDSSARRLTEEVLQAPSRSSVYNVFRNLAERCRKAAPKGVSIDQLIQLGDPEYAPPTKPRTARHLGVSATTNIVLVPMPHEPVEQRSLDEYRVGEPLAWQDDALCAQTNPEGFFPEKGGSTRDSKKICESCEVRDICLEYALQNEERFGIWGGKSERERRPLVQARRAERGRATGKNVSVDKEQDADVA